MRFVGVFISVLKSTRLLSILDFAIGAALFNLRLRSALYFKPALYLKSVYYNLNMSIRSLPTDEFYLLSTAFAFVMRLILN